MTSVFLVAPLLLAGLSSSDLFEEAHQAPPDRRAVVALDVFRQHPDLQRTELDQLWSLVETELVELRLEETEPLMRALHERYQAGWTTVNLALLWQKLGRYDEVNDLFQTAIDQERRTGRGTHGLVNQWGILLLGQQADERGRTLLERAGALGSDDAPCVLARLDLAEDRPRRARARVEPLMLSTEPSAWARRLWGLSLIEP